jgi:D-alanyl-D-alanine carboxypeptidase
MLLQRHGYRGACAATVVALATALVASDGAGTAFASPQGSDAGRRQVLTSGANDLRALGVTGIQALARDDDQVTAVRAGVGDLKKNTPVPRNGSFRMGSNTKTFISVVMLQLVGEGRLSLDDTVDRWLPGVVSGNGNDGRTITIRQLLQHTSGLFNFTADLPMLTSQESFFANRFNHVDPGELVAIAMKHQPNFAPGTSWDYSNTNYILAGMIIQKATGHSWADEVHKRITGPLGLSQTFFPGDSPELPNPHAEGYQQFVSGGPLVDTTEFNTTWADSAGALVTTPTDLAKFWQALQRGRLLAPAQMAEMHTTVLAVTFQGLMPGVRYGLGIMWIPDSCGGHWSHGGDVPGMSTDNGVSPDGKHSVVISLSTQLADQAAQLAVITKAYAIVGSVLCGTR